jgi:hypothetical protein
MGGGSLFDNLSELISKTVGKESPSEEEKSVAQSDLLIETLKIVSVQASEGLGKELNEFLNGRGNLLETTRSAISRSGSSAAKDLAAVLKETFNLSSASANTVAALLVKLIPSINKTTSEEETSKPKRPRKKKTSTSSNVKPAAKKSKRRESSTTSGPSSSSKPKKKKTSGSKKASAARPKQKTATKKKTSTGSNTKKRKSSSRSVDLPVSEEA